MLQDKTSFPGRLFKASILTQEVRMQGSATKRSSTTGTNRLKAAYSYDILN